MPWNRLIMRDDREGVEITIDVKVNHLEVIVPALSYHGYARYDARGNQNYPFRVTPDGAIDWGPDYADSNLQIHGEMVHPNTTFAMHDADEDRPQGYDYRLRIMNWDGREA